ncbi:unnamed protein product [Effrenium voratum]|uniref:Uncharacterized protein n=1 Tax=Effrenium voratum TaxID=2562239 RepID=A0AA36MTV3_9DINO|nr:unnamed protein product [Effrenium voratum]CAJ1457685.1 unnamed protein product [Effrenium voratum]
MNPLRVEMQGLQLADEGSGGKCNQQSHPTPPALHGPWSQLYGNARPAGTCGSTPFNNMIVLILLESNNLGSAGGSWSLGLMASLMPFGELSIRQRCCCATAPRGHCFTDSSPPYAGPGVDF